MRAAGVPICGALAALAVCLPATPALAAAGLEPGVHIDPGSPAEKQYVLPLSQARQTGAGKSSSSSSGPLFGAGITPPRGGGPTASPGAGPRPSTRRAGSRTAGSASAAGGTSASGPLLPSVVVRTARAQGSSAGSGSLLALIGGGLAILVLGGFGGTVLRHSRRPNPSS
jgi:cytochrome c biogenesis protein CcdA